MSGFYQNLQDGLYLKDGVQKHGKLWRDLARNHK